VTNTLKSRAKQGCKLWLHEKHLLITGLIDLCEFEYDKNHTFWFGVGEFSCQPKHEIDIANANSIEVQLDDGRVGCARAVLCATTVSLDYVPIRLVGFTDLMKPMKVP
jgi:hypothetical protein